MEAYVSEFGTSGLSLGSAGEVLRFVKEHRIESIRLWFVDILGFLKSFSITPAELEGAIAEGMGFDGSSVEGYQRINESDMVAFPLPETAQVIPFRIGGARALRMFAQIRNPDRSPYANDPRFILAGALARLGDHGLSHMNAGPEGEFFYFASDQATRVLDQAGYFDLNPVDLGDGLREATVFALHAMGIPVEYSHHEVGPSQHEIDLKYAPAMRMADSVMTYKWLVKEIAHRNGVHATFMPKPLATENGSGMHTHLSLFRDARTNAFFSAEDPFHLSPLARAFMAGVLEHAREICLVTNQWYNSYKRLVPGFEAPVYIAWAQRNRSALIRVPVYKPGKELATRIELRFPDAACNPYLAFAVMLAAGLEGVSGGYRLPDEVTTDIYALNPMERERQHIRSLPHSLYEAIGCARESVLVRRTLGEGVLGKLVETKLGEVESYRKTVTAKEIAEYMVL
ncbi:MAG: glutamine synthetase [Deltaproteobacteria bacterium]|nr:glutamine synthetase [Deltaproteobacteria bacterium]